MRQNYPLLSFILKNELVVAGSTICQKKWKVWADKLLEFISAFNKVEEYKVNT